MTSALRAIFRKNSSGRARITGLDSNDEARVLSSVLKAGSLPTPLDIIEERAVDPSLGKDSDRKGDPLQVLGLVLVPWFMIIYYKILRRSSQCCTHFKRIYSARIYVQLACRSLPGIAGIILTIGMAVDANVLIFERIRRKNWMWKIDLEARWIPATVALCDHLDANITALLLLRLCCITGTGSVRRICNH